MGFICDSFILLGALAFAHWNAIYMWRMVNGVVREIITGNADDIGAVHVDVE